MVEDEEDVLIREIGYSPTLVDDSWEKEMKRNGVDAVRMKRVDRLVEERNNEEYY